MFATPRPVNKNMYNKLNNESPAQTPHWAAAKSRYEHSFATNGVAQNLLPQFDQASVARSLLTKFEQAAQNLPDQTTHFVPATPPKGGFDPCSVIDSRGVFWHKLNGTPGVPEGDSIHTPDNQGVLYTALEKVQAERGESGVISST